MPNLWQYTEWLLFNGPWIRTWQQICEMCGCGLLHEQAWGSRSAVLRIRSCFLTSERSLVSHNVFPSPGVTKQQVLPAVTLSSATAPCDLKAVARRQLFLRQQGELLAWKALGSSPLQVWTLFSSSQPQCHRVKSSCCPLSVPNGGLTSLGAFSSGSVRDTWSIPVLFLPVLGTLSSGLHCHQPKRSW